MFDLSEKDLNKLCDGIVLELSDFDKMPEDKRKKEFTELYISQLTVRRIIDTIHSMSEEELLGISNNKLVQAVLSAVALFTMFGVHVGWMSKKDK